MISSNRGYVDIEGTEIDVMADLACTIRAIKDDRIENGIHPVMTALRILKYVIIGLTYKGQ